MICFARAIQFIGGAAAQSVPPSNTVAPSVTGTAQVGQALIASTGIWAGDAPITYEFQWQASADGATGWADIAGATTSTFTPQVAQQGLYLRARVRATNAAGQSGWIPSVAVGPVAAALAAPVRISAPGIAGTLEVGQTLTVAPLAVYSGNPSPSVSYRWQMRPNGGGTITQLGTGPTLTLTEAQLGMQIRIQDMASNSQGSTSWANGAWQGPVVAAPASRITIPVDDGLGFSAHSFLYQAVAPAPYGALGEYWTGDIAINYSGFSSLKERWDSDGVDRTADYDGALILTEIGDLSTGLADPASPQGIETLQCLYWFALTAQAKGCKLVGIYIPHSPEGVDIDADALAKVQYWLNWLRARPEVTIPVYAIPAPVMVRAMIDRYAPASIFIDGLHLRDASVASPNQMNNAMGQMVRMFLTGQRPTNDPGWDSELIALVDTAWGILQAYGMTGFGGSTDVAPYPVAADPLPDPLEVP